MEETRAPYLIVGLGNPGREYRDTRHNIGFLAIDRLCAMLGISMNRVQSRAIIGVGNVAGRRVILAKPQTFMNLSGQAVGGLLRFYKTPIDQLIVAHDELDLPFGTIRIRPGGGSAGQKGMASIIQYLGSQDFARLRLGIGRPPGQMNPSDFVLKRFHASETETLNILLDRAAEAVRAFITEGVDAAMNRYNGTLVEK
jgi:PTH1 family peptidyl-tRNA hydrolase